MDLVRSEVEKTEFLHLLDLFGHYFKIVLIEIEQLKLLSRRAIRKSLQTLEYLICAPLPVVGDVKGDEFRHLRKCHRELRHLRAVINLDIST